MRPGSLGAAGALTSARWLAAADPIVAGRAPSRVRDGAGIGDLDHPGW